MEESMKNLWMSSVSIAVVATVACAGTPSGARAGGFLKNVVNTVTKAVSDTGHTVEKAAHDTGHTVEKAAQDTGHTVEKAAQDTGHTVEKAAQDTGKSIEQAVHDVGKAGETIYPFGVREIEAIGKSVDEASKRVGEGKFVDAVWHLSTDQLKHTEENAEKAAQESNILRVAGRSPPAPTVVRAARLPMPRGLPTARPRTSVSPSRWA
jgi:hypothetical protein